MRDTQNMRWIMPLFEIETPCVGCCSTVFGEEVCRGCYRYTKEVLAWSQLSLQEKSLAMQRIVGDLSSAMLLYLVIDNMALLEQQRQKRNIPLPECGGSAAVAYALLRAGAENMRDLSAYGLRAVGDAKNLTPLAILRAIEREQRQLALRALSN